MLIDSSGPRLTCALAHADGRIEDLVAEQPGAAQIPTRQIPAGLQAIVVGIGPGSFIGTRTAISFANGYAAASPAPVALYGVNSLAAIAAPQNSPQAAVLRDARRGQWYLWSPDAECKAVAESALPAELGKHGISRLLLEAPDGIRKQAEPPELLVVFAEAGVEVISVSAVPAEGLLALAKSAQPQLYVEPIYLRGFT